jgi:Cof subfamily protein (haloacid dehalogenase superfamily)
MRKPKLVASDLDGTLLLNGTQSLGPEACGLIHRLHENGILFLAASGRQYGNLQKLFAPVKDEIAYLCDNGCRSYYQGRTLSLERMDRALGDEIISAIMAAPGCEVLLSGDECSYAQPKNPEFLTLLKENMGVHAVAVPDLHAIPEPYVKISIYAENVLNTQDSWKARFGTRCTVQISGNVWLDMTPYGVNKGSCLQKILPELQIPAADMIAFGDNENDREMLAVAGCPIVMDTATPSVRNLGRYHTDTVEHALRRILDGEGYDW